MYERMLNKEVMPTEQDIMTFMGERISQLASIFESNLQNRYDLARELRFPFGNNYGWGYKYAHKTKHLCYLFFEREAFTVLLQINGKGKEIFEKNINSYLPKTLELWGQKYPCGEGGWISYRPFSEAEVNEIIKLLEIKAKPKIK